MKIAYLDCPSGISGDMTLAALVDAGVDLAEIQSGIDSLGLPDCRLVAKDVLRHAFRAKHITVEYAPEHAHRHLHHITEMIDRSTLSDRQRKLAKRIFLRLAEAEAKVHGTTIEKVHFHEVGAVDSIADIVGAAIGWDLLGVERIVASAVPTGTGYIQIAHGRCSVPAPATAELLKGIPLADCPIEAELTTPTGAAILASMVDEFGPVPAMTIRNIGYGAGTRDLTEQANVVRLLIGESDSSNSPVETIWMIETNIDDASGELIGYCIDRLWEAGALDVTTMAISMKKNRPGVKISVLCRQEQIAKVEKTMFAQTTTLGVRRWTVARNVVKRVALEVSTPFGSIIGVVAELDSGKVYFSPEFDQAAQIAKERDIPLRDIYTAAQLAFASQPWPPTSSTDGE